MILFDDLKSSTTPVVSTDSTISRNIHILRQIIKTYLLSFNFVISFIDCIQEIQCMPVEL